MSRQEPRLIERLAINDFPEGAISKAWLPIINNGMGEPVRIPILIGRGTQSGPTLGLTAALHGNELNGILLIQKLFWELDLDQLCGNVVGVLVANVPGLICEQRRFNDNVDLNRVAPGKEHGDRSQIYIHRMVDRIISQFDFLIDLHTASFGRINSYYIRANMADAQTARMARLQNAEIILDNPPNDTTLRGTAAAMGIKSITSELRDPHVFQHAVIEDGLTGVRNVLYDQKMLPGSIVCPVRDTLLCDKSYWLHTDEGGILSVLPELGELVEQDQVIAEVRNIFGDLTKQYRAAEPGTVIGKSINPINQTGSRILHLGLHPRPIPCVTEED